jgi:hypothetical protein
VLLLHQLWDPVSRAILGPIMGVNASRQSLTWPVKRNSFAATPVQVTKHFIGDDQNLRSLTMLRHHHRARTAQLTLPTSGVAAAVLATLLVGAPAAHAAPESDAQAAKCGDSLENWTGQTLSGIQHRDNNSDHARPAESTFTFPSDNGHRANWNMKFRGLFDPKGTINTDAYWLNGPGTVEFKSDLGTGKGDMWQFRLTAVAYDGAGKVIAATANTYFPIWYPFLQPVNHYGTADGEPLKAV